MDSEVLNLLVLPLLGGYIFYTRLHATSFAAKRAEGQRLIYSSGVIGVILLLLAHATDELLNETATDRALYETVYATGLLCTIASALVTSMLLLMFCGKSDLLKVKGALPILASLSGFALAGSAAALYIFHFSPRIAVIFTQVLPATLVLFAIVVLVTRWVIDTSRLHYSIVVARLSLTCLALCSGAMLILLQGPRLAANWPSFSNIKYSGTALLAMAIGAVAWIPLNVFLTKKWAWRRTHERGETSGLEYLLFKAFSNLALFQITLKDGKVYVGFLLDMPAPQLRVDGGCIEFVPLKSGYREQATKMVVTTTNYANVLARVAKGANQSGDIVRLALNPAISSMTKVVPIAEVLVAGMFSEKYTDDDFAIKKPVSARAHQQDANKPAADA